MSTLSVGEIKNNFGTKLISFECTSRETEVTAFVQMLDTVAETATKKAVNAFEVLMAGGRQYVKTKPQSRLKKCKIIVVVACFC